MSLDIFLERINENQRQIVLYLHEKFLQYPQVVSKIRFKIPFYYYNSWMCYLNPVKPDKVELVFINGQELSNEQGLLEKRGRKMVSGIILESLETLPIDAVLEIFSEALMLDEHKKMSKKK